MEFQSVRRYAILLLSLALACRNDAPRTPFNGAVALGYVKTQVDNGPRIPGTAAHRKTGDWIVEQVQLTADTVIEQKWTHVTAKGDTLPLRNILARFRPKETQRVLFITHWDTRPISDGTPDPVQRALPMPGANDGASGVAMFIALAEALKKTPPDVGVDLLFVDGEDYGSFDDGKDVLLGSQILRQASARLRLRAALRRAVGHDRQEEHAVPRGDSSPCSARRKSWRSSGRRPPISATRAPSCRSARAR